jgi:two-component system, OmpR family, sensor kinase
LIIALYTLLPIAALVLCLMLLIAIVIARSQRPMVPLAEELSNLADEDGVG